MSLILEQDTIPRGTTLKTFGLGNDPINIYWAGGDLDDLSHAQFCVILHAYLDGASAVELPGWGKASFELDGCWLHAEDSRTVWIGVCDFLDVIDYVFTNTNMVDDSDPRLQLVKGPWLASVEPPPARRSVLSVLREMRLEPGHLDSWNPDAVRLARHRASQYASTV